MQQRKGNEASLGGGNIVLEFGGRIAKEEGGMNGMAQGQGRALVELFIFVIN